VHFVHRERCVKSTQALDQVRNTHLRLRFYFPCSSVDSVAIGLVRKCTLHLDHHLDDRLGGKTDNAKSERQENDQRAEAAGTGFLCQTVHDKQHVKDQPANTEIQRDRLELLNTQDMTLSSLTAR